jgi:dolichol kinase
MKKEIMRKSFHIFFGTVFLALIWLAGTWTSFEIILGCLIIGTLISLAMIKGYNIPWLGNIVKFVERPHEEHFPGKAAVLFFVSALIVLFLFKNQPLIALAALSTQVYGDAAAALIGKPFGRHKIYPKKSVEGTAACLVVAFICLQFFLPLHIALVGAIVATIIEVLPFDDNLWVPIGTGVAIKALLMI